MINYNVLQEFVVVANPVPSPGDDLRVNMTAQVASEQNSPLFHASTGIWEDGYAFHLQHSGNLEPELLTKITERLKKGEPVEFRLLCFMDALDQIGFVGVQRV